MLSPRKCEKRCIGPFSLCHKARLVNHDFHLFYFSTSDGTFLLPQLALCCGTCFALVITVKNRQSPICTVGAVLICYVYALLLRGVECTGTFTDAMQIFKRKIWSFCISVIRDVRSFALMTGQQCHSVTTRSRSEVQENLLPWSDGYSSCDLRDMQEKDINIGAIVSWLSSGNKSKGSIAASSSPETRHYLQCWDALVFKNGILMRKFQKKDGSGEFHQLVVPQCLRKDILFQMHNSLLSGHLGQKKTKEKLLQRYYWYQAREDVNLWVSRCDICGANKSPAHKPTAPLGSMPVEAPLDRLSTDLLGPFVRTPRGNSYILVMTDHFTKW